MRWEDVSDEQLIEEVRNRGYTIQNGEIVMSKQPKALRLADELAIQNQCDFYKVCEEAALELRWLHEENERLREEVRILRLYGNKDCTAMADEALKREYVDEALEQEHVIFAVLPKDSVYQKIVESIVTECIGVLNRRYMGDNNREDFEVRRCVEDLKKHFGVE